MLRALTDLTKLWLVGCLGSEPRLAQSQTRGMQLVRRIGEATAPVEGECGPCPDFLSIPWHCLTTEENHEKTSVTERRSADKCRKWFVCRLGFCGRCHRMACWPLPSLAFASGDGSTIVQRMFRPSYCTSALPTSANFESKLPARAQMSANSRTPRSSCICYLTYQGAPVARRRHLDCIIRSLRRWWGQRISTRGMHSPSWVGWVAYIAGLGSWRQDHSFHSGGHPAYPFFEQPSSWTDRREATRWVTCLGSPPDNELCPPIGLVTWKVLLVGAGWSAVRHARRLSRCS
jgi:hypothetical protein